MPAWYPLVQAARYLGVPPWTLETQPNSLWWQMVAQGAQYAENHAREAHAKRR